MRNILHGSETITPSAEQSISQIMAATERIPNLAEDDLLDAEVGEFLQNYLQLSGEVGTDAV